MILKHSKKLSDFLFQKLNDLTKYLKTKHGANTVRLVLEFLILLILIRILELPFYLANLLGSQIISTFASTLKEILSFIWSFSLYYSYILYSLLTLFHFFKKLRDDKERLTVSNKTKTNNVFKEMIQSFSKLSKLIVRIFLIPFFLIAIFAIVFLVYLSIRAVSGTYLVSLFLFMLAILLFSITGPLIVNSNFTKRRRDKLYNTMFASALLAFVISITVLTLETKNFSYEKQLTNDFDIIENTYNFSLEQDDYDMLKVTAPRNISVIEDNSLSGELVITTSRADTAKVLFENNIAKQRQNINIDYELNLKSSDVGRIIDLLMKCIEDKTIYDYTKIKYGDVYLRINANDLDKLEIVNTNDEKINFSK